MSDDFSQFATALDSPGTHALEVTASATPLDKTTRALYVGAEGSITVTMAGGETVTLVGVPAGSLLPLRVTHVTAGTSVVAIW